MKIILRIDDVGRLPTDSPTQGSDRDLSYFDMWRRKCGIVGLPAIYGVVPTWATNSLQLEGDEQWAVHGWNHAYGYSLNLMDAQIAIKQWKTDIYIPPFNSYTEDTVKTWVLAGGKYFLGGYEHEHIADMIEEVYHIPATHSMYGRAEHLIEAPLTSGVLTLHVPWETKFYYVAMLMEHLKPYLVNIEDIYG